MSKKFQLTFLLIFGVLGYAKAQNDVNIRQENNVFADHPDVVKELEQALAQYRIQILPGPPLGWINLNQ